MLQESRADTGYMVILLALIVITVNAHAAANLAAIDRNELIDKGDGSVFVALQHTPNAGEKLITEFSVAGYVFPFIDTVVTRLKASKALALADHDLVRTPRNRE